jgi:hypothetical protein
MSSPELVDAEHDIGDEDFPTHSPPEYEDIALHDINTPPTEAPPDYSSPMDAQAPELVLPIQGTPQSQSNNSSNAPRPAGRGVGGIPQLPSLRLSALPSIVVNTPTPISSTSAEDNR